MPLLDLLGRWSREEMVEGKATRIPSSVREATAEQRGGGRTLAARSSLPQMREHRREASGVRSLNGENTTCELRLPAN
jgi:hypothetical protein